MAGSTPFIAEILTPEGAVFKDEVTMVSTRTEIGSIGILANHEPVLGLLSPTELRLYKSESDVVSYAQGEGYLQVTKDHVLILVEEAIPPADLNVSELQEKLRKAESDLSAAEDGSEAQAVAGRDKRRWEAFLRVAEA